MQSVLFVCLGNICRSPLAEGVFRAIARRRGLAAGLTIDSAGTGGWHAGEPPDPRAVGVARRHGIDLSPIRARQVEAADFHAFDLILAMDEDNHADLADLDPGDGKAELRLLLDFGAGPVRSVPDPYFGGAEGFEHVFRMIEAAAHGLADHVEAARRVGP